MSNKFAPLEIIFVDYLSGITELKGSANAGLGQRIKLLEPSAHSLQILMNTYSMLSEEERRTFE